MFPRGCKLKQKKNKRWECTTKQKMEIAAICQIVQERVIFNLPIAAVPACVTETEAPVTAPGSPSRGRHAVARRRGAVEHQRVTSAVAGPAALYLPRKSYHCPASTGIKAASSGRHASPRTKTKETVPEGQDSKSRNSPTSAPPPPV